MTPLSEDRRERAFCGVGVRNNGTGWLFSLSPLLALSMSCALCPTPFAQQHLKLLGPPNSGRSVAEWAPSLKRATDACVLASNNASPAQRGPRRDAQPLHATPLAAVLFPAPLRARALYPLATQVPTLCVADSHSEPSCLPAADSSVVLSQDIVETDHMHNILTES